MTAAQENGITDTSQAVMDESGDTYYGAFCYTVIRMLRVFRDFV